LVPVPVREIVVLPPPPPPPLVLLVPPSAAKGAKGVGGGAGEGDDKDGVDEATLLAGVVAFAVTEDGLVATMALADSAVIAFCLLITHNCLCTSLMLSSVNELLCTNRHPQSSQTYSFKLDTI
jgi:hypothetical protein